MLKNKKYNWQNTNYIYLNNSFMKEVALFFSTFFKISFLLSLLLIDRVGLFFSFIINRTFSIMVTPFLKKFFDLHRYRYTKKIIPNQSIQKSVEFFVCCRVESLLILLYTILFKSFKSPLVSLRLYRYIDTQSMFAILYNVSGGCYD